MELGFGRTEAIANVDLTQIEISDARGNVLASFVKPCSILSN
jgi:hypothetical protein